MDPLKFCIKYYLTKIYKLKWDIEYYCLRILYLVIRIILLEWQNIFLFTLKGS